ncbi:MAG: DegT/DnrJ/EryC1/StrS family aminotransferase [Candidatus Paceibacterota bacterium]|jgi:dTDP-4-amino-4,6-dideoxygalactose transaminase
MKKIKKQIGVGCFEITDTERRYVNDVLKTGRLSYGPYTKRFEKEFATAHNMRYAVMVNSGTSALEMAVACLKEVYGWKDGDEVLCPAVTFVASSNVIIANNLKPVFVDIDPRTYNIDPKKIEEKITLRTRAIMAVHLFGQPAAMDKIMRIAKKHKLRVIEDSCETMFAKYKGKSVGSFGDIGCFSTYIAHFLVTGVGGFAVTDNPKYAEILRSLANHGRDNIYISIDDDKGKSDAELSEVISRRFNFVRRGYSYRVTEFEGALGCAQFERRRDIVHNRRKNGVYFNKYLAPFSKHLQLPATTQGVDHMFMMYPIVIKKNSPVQKSELTHFLETHNIETRDMVPLINQPYIRSLYGDLEAQYPIAKWINNNGFYIASHQMLTPAERKYIVSVFGEFFKKW